MTMLFLLVATAVTHLAPEEFVSAVEAARTPTYPRYIDPRWLQMESAIIVDGVVVPARDIPEKVVAKAEEELANIVKDVPKDRAWKGILTQERRWQPMYIRWTDGKRQFTWIDRDQYAIFVVDGVGEFAKSNQELVKARTAGILLLPRLTKLPAGTTWNSTFNPLPDKIHFRIVHGALANAGRRDDSPLLTWTDSVTFWTNGKTAIYRFDFYVPTQGDPRSVAGVRPVPPRSDRFKQIEAG